MPAGLWRLRRSVQVGGPGIGGGVRGVGGTLGVPSRPKSLGWVCGALGGLNRGFSLGPIVATGAVEAERWEEERRGSERGLVTGYGGSAQL